MNSIPDILPLSEWLLNGEQPLVIAGPCSAETEEQVLLTARQLAAIPEVKVYRAGIWKPRTRPRDFEGAGDQGLLWLKKVKQETGLLTCVEVANPRHAEACLEAGIDILWIGARTTVNPFYIQEIADSLAGTDIPVMIKNPVNPDLKLWMGAFERFYNTGKRKLIAIHRGFYFFNKSEYRNAPMWEIPIELKRQFPSLPIITDPSHICGKREMIFDVSQKAMDLEMDGLMIESHCNPDAALTDARQQLSPAQLSEVIKNLIIREKTGNVDIQNKLDQLRAEIDKLDAVMIEVLSKRFAIVREIGNYKKDNNITILQQKRWDYLLNDRSSLAEREGVSIEFINHLLELIHEESIQIQTDIMNKSLG